jgi:hypothetical protein
MQKLAIIRMRIDFVEYLFLHIFSMKEEFANFEEHETIQADVFHSICHSTLTVHGCPPFDVKCLQLSLLDLQYRYIQINCFIYK